MTGFIDAIDKGAQGLVFGNSMFLPFRLDLLSIWAGKEMSFLSSPEVIVDLCEGNGEVAVREGASWTNIVLRRYRDLAREFGNGKGHVLLYAVEKANDLFVQEHRHYIRIVFSAHEKEISFELIDDPFQL
ncbi:MAG: hypothetical protein HGB29_03945 [Chlorobiaceae bacterium]|nr:hypothetical protein [Chlorobiaceae bacterium]NTW73994.1 hypothetical protein [Chlorobiaceae bacterium]